MNAVPTGPAERTPDVRRAHAPADYHTHTRRCGHAVGTAAEYVEAARARGLAGIGICDHLPLVGRRDAELTMDISELDDYVGEVLELRRAFPGFVLLGIEADYEPETIDVVRELLASYPFDYVIGSVHMLDGWAFDDPRNTESWAEREVRGAYLRYFELVSEAADSGAFTILGHLDLIKKFGHRPPEPVQGALQAVVDRIARAGVAVEINTAGLRKPVAEMYPGADLLRLLHLSAVPLAFGSDAHRPTDVGRDFTAAVENARSAGYTEYARLAPGRNGGRGRISPAPLPEVPGTSSDPELSATTTSATEAR